MYSITDHNALKVEHSNKNNRKKTCKQLEVEQHISQWQMGHWWNKRGN
jgi:hypothetical protein